MQNIDNWGKEMKFLIPALGTFLITVICKFPDYAIQHMANIQAIVLHLMNPEIRME